MWYYIVWHYNNHIPTSQFEYNNVHSVMHVFTDKEIHGGFPKRHPLCFRVFLLHAHVFTALF